MGRLASWLAWAVCALSLTLTALNFLLIAMNVSLNTPAYVFWPELTFLAVGYSVIGAVIASRLPNHPIGWICCAIGLIAAVDHFSGEYSLYALLAQPHSQQASLLLYRPASTQVEAVAIPLTRCQEKIVR